MKQENAHLGSSRRKAATRTMSSALTVSVNSPWLVTQPVTAPGSAPATARPRDSIVSLVIWSPLDGSDAPNLLLQQQHTVKQRLGGGRAARNIDVHWHDAVATAYHRVGIVVITAAVGARAHGDHIARLRHLVVDLAQRRRHLVGERAGHDHDIGLTGRGA